MIRHPSSTRANSRGKAPNNLLLEKKYKVLMVRRWHVTKKRLHIKIYEIPGDNEKKGPEGRGQVAKK